MFDRLADWVNGDPNLIRLGRFMRAEFLIEVGDIPYHVAIEEGRVAAVRVGPFKMRSWAFAIRAPAASWEEFWRHEPKPGFQDLFAMTRYGHAALDGDHAVLLANLRYVKELLALPRRKGGRGDPS